MNTTTNNAAAIAAMTPEQIEKREAARAEILGTFNRQRAEAVAALELLSTSPFDHYVVICETVPLKFSRGADGKTAVQTTTVAGATRYPTKSSAGRMAADVKNGNGKAGTVFEAKEALRADIAKLDEMLACFAAV